MKSFSTSPRVAVIIATYNRPKLLERAIRSVLGQTYRDFEVLVVDDRGDPATRPVVEGIAEEDRRVRYIPNETRLGLMENKNKGVRLSSPSVRYVAILDDDDTYLPRFLERTVEALDFDSETI